MVQNVKFLKAAICGLLLFFCCNLTKGQPVDTLASWVDEQIELVLDRFYYTDFDSAVVYLQPLGQLAEKQQLWQQYIRIELEKAYLSRRHDKVDSVAHFIGLASGLLEQYSSSLSKEAAITLTDDLSYIKGMHYYYSGDLANSIVTFKELVASYESNDNLDSLSLSSSYINLGQFHFYLEDYENATSYFQQAWAWLPKKDPNYDERDYDYEVAFIGTLIGKSKFKLGQLTNVSNLLSDARVLFSKSLATLTGRKHLVSHHKLLSNTYNHLTEYYTEMGQPDSAIFYAEAMLSVPLKSDYDQLVNRLSAGKTYLTNHKYKKARVLFEESSKLANKTYKEKHHLRAQVLHHIGQWHVHQEDWESVLKYYQRALEQIAISFNGNEDVYENPKLEEITFDKEFLEILLLKADALFQWHQSNNDQQLLLGSIDTYELAMATVDRMRQGFLLPESRLFLSAKSVSIYEKSLEACYRAYDLGLGDVYLELAFQVMEQNKSNLLLEAVQDVTAKNYTGIDKILIEKEQAFKSKIAYLKRQLSGQKQEDVEKTNTWKQEIFEAQQAYQQLTLQLEADHPEYYQLKYHTQSVSLGKLQEKMRDNQALIEYFYGDSSLYVMGISKDQTVFTKIKLDQDLDRTLTSYIGRLNHHRFSSDYGTESTFMDEGYILYQQLLAPVLSELGNHVTSLQIIPDGLLGYLPFEILLTGPLLDEELVYKSLPYLVKDYTIATEFSATLWKEAIGMKDNRNLPYLGFAPSFEGEEGTIGRLALRGGGVNQLMPLLYNQKEVKEAQKLFGGKIFLGPSATEADFRTYASQTKILHLSTHAFARDQQVQYSGLVFYQPSDSSDEANDGYVYLDELYNLQLSSELAVLSACQTATGELVRGEGIMSLGRAFKYAGCPNIVMSLWSVPDQSTSIVMKYFYQELKQGMGKAEALREAKLRYLDQADANTADPYYWAAFTLIGDDLPLSVTTNKTRNILLVIAAFVVLTLASTYTRRRFRANS